MYHIYQFDSNEINLGGGYYGSNYEVRNRFYLSELSTEEFKKLGYNISLDSTSDIKQYCISNFSIYDSKNFDYFTIDEVRNYIKDGKFYLISNYTINKKDGVGYHTMVFFYAIQNNIEHHFA